MPRTESSWWWLVIALALFELAALLVVICLERLKRRHRSGKAERIVKLEPHDPKWVLREIDRLCSGGDLSESTISRMSKADRAFFEVCVIDVLKAGSREDQHRLRSALIKNGYDELCSRRVMGADFSDRVRATALLKLLRPHWKDTSGDPEGYSDRNRKARAAGRSTGPLNPEQ